MMPSKLIISAPIPATATVKREWNTARAFLRHGQGHDEKLAFLGVFRCFHEETNDSAKSEEYQRNVNGKLHYLQEKGSRRKS